MPEKVVVRKVYCGADGTLLISEDNAIFAFGCNRHNKLGLNHRQGFLMAMKNIFTNINVEGSVPN